MKLRRITPLGDTDPFTPTPARPVRVRSRSMPADTHFEPHRHAWAQLAYCASGTVQVTVSVAQGTVSYIVPPSRAVWVAPGALHAITVREQAEFRTLYIDASATPAGWHGCRMIVVSPLVRELVGALDAPGTAPSATPREQLLGALVLGEIERAATQAIGVPLPDAQSGDKRLRALCDAVLGAPGGGATLAGRAAAAGASERTMARLFRDELGMGFGEWQRQAVLAHALPMLARGQPVGRVAEACGYASESAFGAMFRQAMGQPPSHFRGPAARI